MRNSKMEKLLPQAKTMYCLHGYSKSEICKRLGICEKTLFNWRTKSEENGTNWDAEKEQLGANCKSLDSIVFSIGEKLARKIDADLDAGQYPDKAAGSQMLKILDKIAIIKKNVAEVQTSETPSLQEETENTLKEIDKRLGLF